MPFKLKMLLILIISIGASQRMGAQAVEPATGARHPRFELSSDMFGFDAPSTQLFLGWQRNMNSMLQIGLDRLSGCLDQSRPESWIWRLSLLGAFSAVSTVANRAFSITAHDVHHLEAARAIGATTAKMVRSDNGSDMSIWEFFLEAFNPGSEPGLYLYSKSNPTPDEQAYVAGIGLDANMMIADSIAGRIVRGEGNVMDLAPYVLNKAWGIGYFMEAGPTSDAAFYMSLLRGQGYDAVTRDSVIALNAASWLLSGGMLSLAMGAIDYIAGLRSAVRPLGISIGDTSLYWPELTTWLNPQNVSLLVLVNAAWREIFLARLGIEVPVLGNTGVNPEVTIGATVWISSVGLGLDVTSQFDGFPFLKGRAEIRLSDMFSAGIEGFYGERTTMREVREYPSGPGMAAFLTAAF